MPRANIVKQIEVENTARVKQVLGIFDIQDANKSTHEMNVDIPIDGVNWNIGAIVGPSGSGKSTIAKELFNKNLITEFSWDSRKSIIDSFNKSAGIKDIAGALSSVGFSSPPLWLRPYHVLSNGEKFRVDMARAIIDSDDFFLIDEFTSVVDRQVAKIGSYAFQKAIRKRNKKFIAISCHFDILEWLEPDWVFNTETCEFQITRGMLRRPSIEISIKKVPRTYWELFKKYHYLNTSINSAAQCYCAFIYDKPVAFSCVLSFPHPSRPGWREHRTVCHPDYQGVGIGNALSDFMGALYSCKKPYFSNTGNPAMISYRNKSALWKMGRKPSFSVPGGKLCDASISKTYATKRLTASFEYIGAKDFEAAKMFGIL